MTALPHARVLLPRPVVVLALVLASVTARAADEPPVTLTVEANATQVRVGDVFQLDVTLAMSGTAGEPDELVLPDLSAFELVRQERAPTSQRTVIVNGRMSASRSFGFVFHLRATTPGEKTIGAGRARMASHVSTTRPLVISVVEREKAGTGGLSSTLDPAARFAGQELPPYFVDARFERDEAWVGQQVLLTVDIYSTDYADLDLRDLKPPKPPGFWTEVLETPARIRPTQRTVGGKSYLVYQVMRVALFPLEAGEHVLEPVSVTVLTTRGSWRRRNEVTLTSDPVKLIAKPLPDEGRPREFPVGNVGQWQLKAEVSERELPLGQPFTLKVTAGGEGNLQALVLPPVEQEIEGARVFPPTTSEVKGAQQGLLHGAKSVEVLVQPRRAGSFEVPSFSLPYFDPADGRYKVARSERLAVRVKAGTLDDGSARAAGGGRIVRNARPVQRRLSPPALGGPVYRSAGYLGTLGGGAALALVVFGLGVARARRRETLDAASARRRKARHRALEAARRDKDLAAVERVVLEGLAERFGEEVRAMSLEELAAFLDDKLPQGARGRLLGWLESAQAARYAPRGGADKKGLFEDADALLTTLEEAS